MVDFKNMRTEAVSRTEDSVDQGLRSYMLGVYNLMATGLVITAGAAMVTSWLAEASEQFALLIYASPLRFVVMFAPLVAAFFLSFRIQSLTTFAAQMLFIGYAALVGVSLSSIFLVYTEESIAQTFFITAASFGALSLYGYTTKRDLRPLAVFMFIGLIGLLLASFINIFIAQETIHFAISAIGVFIFAGLTAYDTQSIKEMYYEGDSRDTAGRKIVIGALRLYLDFINMFIFLLNFLGNRD